MQAAAQRCLLVLLLALSNHGPADAMRQARRGPEQPNHSVVAATAKEHAAPNASLGVKHQPAPAKASSVVKHAAVSGNISVASPQNAKPTAVDVRKLRVKLQAVVEGLQHMLDGKNGTLANAKVAPALQVFIKELHLALVNVTASEDPAVAMRKLKGAASSINTLVHDLSARQESLMLEDESEHESLLLGVLMSKQHEPMDKQIEVLRSSDFAHLPVCQALLAAHNTSAALYLQAADFLDWHRGGNVSTAMAGAAPGLKAEKLADALSKRVQSMEMEFKAKEASHQKHMQVLTGRAKSASSQKERHLAEMLAKREARAFKKFAVLRSSNIATMKSAVEAVKKGDMAALQRARAALLTSLQALRSQNQGFLVLLSLGHRAMGTDCPYCAAQCIEKCRQEGHQYVKCLGVCADAGK